MVFKGHGIYVGMQNLEQFFGTEAVVRVPVCAGGYLCMCVRIAAALLFVRCSVVDWSVVRRRAHAN